MPYSFHAEVAGGWGEDTAVDATVHPPIVEYLDYEVQGWLGDDLITSFPVHLVSPRLLEAMQRAGLRGFSEQPSSKYTISIDEQLLLLEGEDVKNSYVLEFKWISVGEGLDPDLFLTEGFLLGLSDKAWQVISDFNVSNGVVERLG
ncbi:hypothetical protein [Tsukamurella pulmonis]|uniref:hypothetical protein n=1 Tax=Tsukamurella pulmonis TaxID=47312 RepID=UPI001403845E|nr:hypothetical protein [Tsukamurella pulmonis]